MEIRNKLFNKTGALNLQVFAFKHKTLEDFCGMTFS